MQNKANFKNARIYICPCITNAYSNIIALELPKNKAKQSQFKPNFELKLALFSPELALFYKEIFAFAKNLKVL
jgi:hypothetical protein